MPSKKRKFLKPSLPTASGWVSKVAVMLFMSVSFFKGESRLHGIVAFVEPHVAPLLVRPIRFQFLQLCCLGARMVDRPLLPTASNLGTHLVFRPFLCNATPPMFLIILKFLSQGLGLGLGNAANGWRYLGPPLRPAASLLVKGEGGRLRRTEPRIICIYIYVMCTM